MHAGLQLSVRPPKHTSSTLPISFLLLYHSCLRNCSARLMCPFPVKSLGSGGCRWCFESSLNAEAARAVGTPQRLNPSHTCNVQRRYDNVALQACGQPMTKLGCMQPPMYTQCALCIHSKSQMIKSRSIGARGYINALTARSYITCGPRCDKPYIYATSSRNLALAMWLVLGWLLAAASALLAWSYQRSDNALGRPCKRDNVTLI